MKKMIITLPAILIFAGCSLCAKVGVPNMTDFQAKATEGTASTDTQAIEISWIFSTEDTDADDDFTVRIYRSENKADLIQEADQKDEDAEPKAKIYATAEGKKKIWKDLRPLANKKLFYQIQFMDQDDKGKKFAQSPWSKIIEVNCPDYTPKVRASVTESTEEGEKVSVSIYTYGKSDWNNKSVIVDRDYGTSGEDYEDFNRTELTKDQISKAFSENVIIQIKHKTATCKGLPGTITVYIDNWRELSEKIKADPSVYDIKPIINIKQDGTKFTYEWNNSAKEATSFDIEYVPNDGKIYELNDTTKRSITCTYPDDVKFGSCSVIGKKTVRTSKGKYFTFESTKTQATVIDLF